MGILNTYTVEAVDNESRLLDFIIKNIKEIQTRNGAKKAIKKGLIKVNNKNCTTATFLTSNDKVSIFEDDIIVDRVYELKLAIHYEDEHLAIIFKPAGIGVSGNYFRTIQNALNYNITPSSLPDKLAIPRPVHRLDNPTSGLLIIAKTSTANIRLGEMLAQKKISKYYHAIVLGQPKAEGEINNEIASKPATSQYQTINTIHHKRLGQISLTKLSPITGRTHQLRIHMSEIGHHIIGDKEHGNDASNKLGKGLFLCATNISLHHPITNDKLEISADLPNKFTKLINS